MSYFLFFVPPNTFYRSTQLLVSTGAESICADDTSANPQMILALVPPLFFVFMPTKLVTAVKQIAQIYLQDLALLASAKFQKLTCSLQAQKI